MKRRAIWMRAAGLGVVAGSRSMLAPALVSRASRHPGASRVWSTLVALELVADKTPWIPSRISALPLAGRALLGAAVGHAIASSRRSRFRRRSKLETPLVAAIVGAASAVASACILHELRVRVARRGPTANVVAGLLEDAAAVASGRALASP